MCNCNKNEYAPVPSKLQDIIKHTSQEWTFRFTYVGDVKPGQFFQISIPKVGECPISVSGIGPDYVDLTLRAVGKVTDYLFENYKAGDSLFLRGPYGNGFDVHEFEGGELIIVVGGTAVSPVRGVVQYLCETPEGYDGKVGLVTKYIPDIPIRDISKCKAIVVGPPPMIKFSMIELVKRGLSEDNVWISDSRRMSCGIGKCGHCRINDKYVCIDGPVFKFSEHKTLID